MSSPPRPPAAASRLADSVTRRIALRDRHAADAARDRDAGVHQPGDGAADDAGDDPDRRSSRVFREQRLARARPRRARSSSCSGAASVGSARQHRLRLAPRDLEQLRQLVERGRARPTALPPGAFRTGRRRRAGRDRPRPARSRPGWRRPARAGARASSDSADVARAQETDPRPAAPPHPPAQLVKLRDAEAIRLLDDHDGRVRHVDAQLDDGGRDQHLRRAAARTRAASPPSPRRSAPRAAGRRAPGAAARSSRACCATAVTASSRRATSRTAQTTNAWRPSAIASRSALVGGAPLVGAHAHDRRGGRAPRGRSVRNDASRSPCSASARLRGIGVADIDSRCGTPPAATPARRAPRARSRRSGAARRRSPAPRRGSRTAASSSACVPMSSATRPAAARSSSAARAARRRARRSSSRDLASRGAPPPAAARAPAARRAPRSAPSSGVCPPAAATSAAAPSATAVLPLPTSPTSRRCIGAGAREVRGDVVERAPLRRGQREPERRLQARAHAARRRRRHRQRRRARRRPPPQEGDLRDEQRLERDAPARPRQRARRATSPASPGACSARNDSASVGRSSRARVAAGSSSGRARARAPPAPTSRIDASVRRLTPSTSA